MNVQNFKFGMFVQYVWKLAPYLRVTFTYMLGALVIGMVFGFLFAVMKLGKSRILRAAAVGYTAVMRSLPSIVLLFLVYYGLPRLVREVSGVNIAGASKVYFVILTLGLFNIASMSELMKSAYSAVNRGQYEAAVSNGLNSRQAFFRIVLPQAFRFSIPNLGNTVVMLLKEGALGFTIGLVDVLGQARVINSNTYQNDILEVYLAMAVVYWVVSILIDRFFKWLERRLAYGTQGGALSWPGRKSGGKVSA